MVTIAVANQHQSVTITEEEKSVKLSIQNADKQTDLILSTVEAMSISNNLKRLVSYLDSETSKGR